MRIRELLTKYQNLFFLWVLQKKLNGCRNVLDVGCGYDSPLSKLPKKFWIEGIDILEKNIALCKKNNTHNKYKIGDIKKINQYYRQNSFDAVIALDVVEHFIVKDALSLIKKMETIAKKRVIILTPNGFYEQGEIFDNPYQIHKSGWKKSDLEKLGYKTYGLRGLKFIRGDNANIKFRPWLFWGGLSFLSEILLYFFPSLSFDLLAIKELNKS
jgi:2-polyprenyl-3-methyl-5-hydroxy-6-metoxy-1,4-benzoquinol methylase